MSIKTKDKYIRLFILVFFINIFAVTIVNSDDNNNFSKDVDEVNYIVEAINIVNSYGCPPFDGLISGLMKENRKIFFIIYLVWLFYDYAHEKFFESFKNLPDDLGEFKNDDRLIKEWLPLLLGFLVERQDRIKYAIDVGILKDELIGLLGCKSKKYGYIAKVIKEMTELTTRVSLKITNGAENIVNEVRGILAFNLCPLMEAGLFDYIIDPIWRDKLGFSEDDSRFYNASRIIFGAICNLTLDLSINFDDPNPLERVLDDLIIEITCLLGAENSERWIAKIRN